MTNAFQAVNDFESAVAKFAGSRFAVAVDSCTSALFLCCRYLSVGKVYLPRTYCSVPAAVLHAGGQVDWLPREWSGEYRLDPYPIVDSAGRFRRGMYRPSEFRCVCFHWTKIVPCGKGGMILHDDPAADEWFRLARYSGRHACDQFADPGFQLAGWNLYMDPAIAARGLALLKNLPDAPPDCRNQDSYPPLEENPIYRTADERTRYRLPAPWDVSERWSHDGLTFRPVTLEDGPTVVSWRGRSDTSRWFCSLRNITLEAHAEFIANKPPNDHVWMVEREGIPIGMASLTIDGDQAEAGRLLVDPDRRGELIGVRIGEAVWFHGLKTLGLKRLWCEVLADNQQVMKFHRLTGWTEISRREHPRGELVRFERYEL